MEAMETMEKDAAGTALDRAAACPCGSGKSYGACCAPCPEDGVWPEAPEALMRARYTAYALGRYEFLVESTLPEARTPDLTAEKLRESAGEAQFIRLEVAGAGPSQRFEGRDCETVDYWAFYRYGESTMQLGERAGFARGEDGRLYYAGGEELRRAPFQRQAPKVGRNDPCPCGSGKKYKKCCGRSQA